METKHVWFIVLLLSCGMAAGAFASEDSGASSSSSSGGASSLTAGERALFEAVSLGAADGVRMLLDNKNITVNAVDHEGNTALIWAVILRNYKIVGMLLNHKYKDKNKNINVNAADRAGQTALDHALDPMFGSPTIAKLLQDHGARTGEQVRKDAAAHGGSSSH